MAAPRRSATRSLVGFALILGGWFAYEKWSSDIARAPEDGANDALMRASLVWPEPSTVTVPSHAPGQPNWPIFPPPELAPESIEIVTTAPTGVPTAVQTSAGRAWQAFVRVLYSNMALIVGTLERFYNGLMHSRQLQLTVAMFALLSTVLVLVLGSHLYTAFMFLYYIIAVPIRLAFTPFAWLFHVVITIFARLYNNLRRTRELGELQERFRGQFIQNVNLRAQNTDLTNRLDSMTRRAEAAQSNDRQRRTDYDRAFNAQNELIESNRADLDTLNQPRQELFTSREQTRVANEARSRQPSLAASPIVTVSSAPVPEPLPWSPMFAVDTAPAAPHLGFSTTTSVATRPIPTSVRTTTAQNQVPATEKHHLIAEVQRLKELRKTDAAELAKLRSQAQKDETLAESVSSANRSSSEGMKELLTIIEQRDSLISDLRRRLKVQFVIAEQEHNQTKKALATRSAEHKATEERATQSATEYKAALGKVSEQEILIADLTYKLQAAEDENKANKEALGSKAAQSELDDCENRVLKLNTDIEACQDALVQANEAVTAKTTEKKALEARISQVTLELEEANSLRHFRDNKIRTSKLRIHELEQELEAAQSSNAHLASELQIAEDVQTATRQDLEGKIAELDAAKAFIEKLIADAETAAHKKEEAYKEALAAERAEHKKTRNALAAAQKADGTCKEDLAVEKANHKKTQDALLAAEEAQKATGKALEAVAADYKSAETRVDKLTADLEAAKEEDRACKKTLAIEMEKHNKTQDALVTAQSQNKVCQETLTAEKAGHNRTRNAQADVQNKSKDALGAERHEHKKTKDALAAARNQAKACKDALAAEQSKHKDTKKRLKDSETVYKEHEETRSKLRLAQHDLESCKKNHKIIKSERDAAQSRISELETAAEQKPGQAQIDSNELNAKLNSYKEELEATRVKLTTTQNALTFTQYTLTTTQNTLASVGSDRAQARERLTAVESDLAQARESQAAEAARHAETTEWLTHVNTNYTQTLMQLAGSKALVQEQQTRLADLEERLRTGERDPSVDNGGIPSTPSSNRTLPTWPTNSPTSIYSLPIMRPVRHHPEERRFSLRPDNRIVLRPGEEDPNGDTATPSSISEAEEPQQPAAGPPLGPQPQPEHARTPPQGEWPPATASFRRPRALPLHPMHPMHPDNIRRREQQAEGGMQTAPLPGDFGQRPGTAPPAFPRPQGQPIHPATAPIMSSHNQGTVRGEFVWNRLAWQPPHPAPFNPNVLNSNTYNPHAFSFPRQNPSPSTPEDKSQ